MLERLRVLLRRALSVPKAGAVVDWLWKLQQDTDTRFRLWAADYQRDVEELRQEQARLSETVRMMALAQAKRDVEEMEARRGISETHASRE